MLGVSQAYISQLERGGRPISRKLAARLARLPDLSPAVVPPAHAELDAADADLADDLAALGYPGSRHTSTRDAASAATGIHAGAQAGSRAGGRSRVPRNPAAVLVAVLRRRQVAPSVMAAMPWVLLTHTDLDTAWLVDQARRRNLQNRLGFLTDLALDVLRARRPQADQPGTAGSTQTAGGAGTADDLERLERLRSDLETSRLANPDTLARVLTPAERQFFEEHRGAAARHWNLLTGLTVSQLPYK